jgi:DNA repair protein REV1
LLEGISGDGFASGILKGVSIYVSCPSPFFATFTHLRQINGYTEPSNQTLRQLILKHGGVYQPYLDQKAIATHIITTSLTPAKVREFKNMKVSRAACEQPSTLG